MSTVILPQGLSLENLLKLLADYNQEIKTVKSEIAYCADKATIVGVVAKMIFPANCSPDAIKKYHQMLDLLLKKKSEILNQIAKAQGAGVKSKGKGSISGGSSADGSQRQYQSTLSYGETTHNGDGGSTDDNVKTTDKPSAMDWLKQITDTLGTVKETVAVIKGQGTDNTTATGGANNTPPPAASKGLSPLQWALIAVGVVGIGVGIYLMGKKK